MKNLKSLDNFKDNNISLKEMSKIMGGTETTDRCVCTQDTVDKCGQGDMNQQIFIDGELCCEFELKDPCIAPQ